MKHTFSINIDEVGANLLDTLPFLQKNGIDVVELRTLEGKNFANFTKSEVGALRLDLDAIGITVCAIASPLFKWYKVKPEKIQAFDDFNFPCILTDDEKVASIERVMSNAVQIGAQKVRVFSGLNGGTPNIEEILSDPIFPEMLQVSAKNKLMVLIENEPVCHAYTMNSIKKMLDFFPQLQLWLDIANFYQIGDQITLDQIRELLPRVYHIHLKDFIIKDGRMCYVPLGEGVIPWQNILAFVLAEATHPISLSIETHVTTHRIDAAQKSVSYFRKIMSTIIGA